MAFKIAHLHSFVCVCVCFVSSFFPSCALHIPITRIHSLKHTRSHVYSAYIQQQIDTPVCRSFLSQLLEFARLVSVIMLAVVVVWCCFLVVEIELSYRVEVCRVVFFPSSPIFLLQAFSFTVLSNAMCVCVFVCFSFSNLQQHCCITFSFACQQLCCAAAVGAVVIDGSYAFYSHLYTIVNGSLLQSFNAI